ncbi:MAG: hypothetical protein ACOCVZ_07030, partial [Gemmatimonadota bacterium]
MIELDARGDFGLSWLEASGPHSGIVLSTRVRLARNLQGHPFGRRVEPEERLRIRTAVQQAARRSTLLRDGASVDIESLPELSRKVLLERHLVSRELIGVNAPGPYTGAGLIMGAAEQAGLMVNEEDHMRL